MANVIEQIVQPGKFASQTIEMVVRSNERGPQGVQGDPGDAATINAGNAYTIEYGKQPVVMNSGTSSNATFDFYIPEGKPGAIHYYAGPGINITEDNRIEATGEMAVYWGDLVGSMSNQTDLTNALNGKQAKLTAGSNIQINGATISATDTTYNDFVGTNGSIPGTSGLVPAPTTSDRYDVLHGDGTWSLISSNNIANNGVSSTNIASNAVTTDKINNSAVTTDKLASESVTVSKLDRASVIDLFYPVGTYYETSDSNFNPNTVWGGTWVKDTAGRVTVAYDSLQTEFDALGETGGSKTHTHGSSEMIAASEMLLGSGAGRVYTDFLGRTGGTYTQTSRWYIDGAYSEPTFSESSNSGLAIIGNTDSGSSLQPYIVVNRWHRTA